MSMFTNPLKAVKKAATLLDVTMGGGLGTATNVAIKDSKKAKPNTSMATGVDALAEYNARQRQLAADSKRQNKKGGIWSILRHIKKDPLIKASPGGRTKKDYKAKVAVASPDVQENTLRYANERSANLRRNGRKASTTLSSGSKLG